MKQRDYNVIDITNDVRALERVGHRPGVSAVAKVAGITIPRAKRLLTSAYKSGLLYCRNDSYRSNVTRKVYQTTLTAIGVVGALKEHNAQREMTVIHDDTK
jgi:hypothetical protein